MGVGGAVGARGDVRAQLRSRAGRHWRAAQVQARRRHAAGRALPDLLVLGAQRGGTTSLYRWLAGHPQVHAPLDKEIQFFTVEWTRGLDWYRCHFGPRDAGQVNFEASPYYLYHPSAPARVASVLPRARFVALLRDPAARAWSHYHHNLRLGLETLAFDDATAAERERLDGEADRLAADPTYVSVAHRHHSYLDRGRYGVQLARWHRVAGDRLLVVRSDELFAEPHRTFQRILDFAGLDPWRPPSYDEASRRSTSTPPLPRAVASRLREVVRDGDQPLPSALAVDVATWAA